MWKSEPVHNKFRYLAEQITKQSVQPEPEFLLAVLVPENKIIIKIRK